MFGGIPFGFGPGVRFVHMDGMPGMHRMPGRGGGDDEEEEAPKKEVRTLCFPLGDGIESCPPRPDAWKHGVECVLTPRKCAPASQVNTTKLYELLGVEKSASAADIKRAYLKLAREVRVAGVCRLWPVAVGRSVAAAVPRSRRCRHLDGSQDLWATEFEGTRSLSGRS